jgi:hypothetical protein
MLYMHAMSEQIWQENSLCFQARNRKLSEENFTVGKMEAVNNIQ